MGAQTTVLFQTRNFCTFDTARCHAEGEKLSLPENQTHGSEIHQHPAATRGADGQDFNDNGRISPVKITVKTLFW